MRSHLRVIDVAAVLGALQLDTIHTHTLKQPWFKKGNEHITSCGGPIYAKRNCCWKVVIMVIITGARNEFMYLKQSGKGDLH